MLVQQNERADTVLVYKWSRVEGFCTALLRMLYFLAICQRKGYYFILNTQKFQFSGIPYTDVFKPFWSEETNRSVLESAKQIHLFGGPPDGNNDDPTQHYRVRDDARFLKYGNDELFERRGFRSFVERPWEKNPLRCKKVRSRHREWVEFGAKHNLFAEEDLPDSWDAFIPAGLFAKIYQLQDEVREQVDGLKQNINLPEDYQAIQVRQMYDYVINMYKGHYERPPPLKEYLNKLDSDIQNVYVATDLEDIVKRLRREEICSYQYHSLIQENKKPHLELDVESRQDRTASLAYLLADIELCIQARKFIGNHRSSVSDTILYLRRDFGKEVDYPVKWKRDAWYMILRSNLRRIHNRLRIKFKHKLNRLLNS